MSKQAGEHESGYSYTGFKNSNWCKKVWLPYNYKLVQAAALPDSELAEELREFHD